MRKGWVVQENYDCSNPVDEEGFTEITKFYTLWNCKIYFRSVEHFLENQGNQNCKKKIGFTSSIDEINICEQWRNIFVAQL